MLFRRRISIQERVDFAKNLSIMLRSGIAINDALFALSEQSADAHLQKVIARIQTDIENGTPLSMAFNKEIALFGPIFVSMLKAGEQSGTLQESLQFLSNWLSRSADLHREVSTATLYPKLVFGASLILGGGLAVFILPMLVPLFVGMDIELPMITSILLSVSLFVQQYWFLVIVGCIALSALAMILVRIRSVRRVYHAILITLPFLGPLLKNYQLALITQLFATLLRSGLSLNESIRIVSEATTNIHYQEALHDVETSTVRGTSLSASLQMHPRLFPKLVVNIVAIGEQSGTLSQSLEHLSEFYEKDVSMQARKLPTIIEPVLLIGIAGIVGFVALAIIMPIYELTGNISR